MNKETFTYICEEIREFVEKLSTNLRKALTVKMRVAIAFDFYSGSCDYRATSNLFGIGQLTVCNILHAVSEAIDEKLLPKLICLPNEAEVQTFIREFEEISGFPQAVGAIDGCHIRIKAPLKDAEDYINTKDYHSIVLHGLVDNNYIFCDVFVGSPGKSHDPRIFKIPPLYLECLQRTFFPRILSRYMQNISIPTLILGVSTNPLEEFIMKRYADRGDLNPQEKRYNVALSKSRVVVENAFGRLKGIFQCSSTRLDTSVQKTVSVTACCTSHNVCFKDWLQNSDTDVGENIPHPGDCCGFRLGQAMRELGQLH